MINDILWPIYGKAGAMYNNFMAMGGVMILSFFLIGCVMLFNQIREGDCLAFGKHVWKLLMTVILLFEFLTLAGLTAWAIEGISIKIMTDEKQEGTFIKKIDDPIQALLERAEVVRGKVNKTYAKVWEKNLEAIQEAKGTGNKLKESLKATFNMATKGVENVSGGFLGLKLVDFCYWIAIVCVMVLFLLQGFVQALMVGFASIVIPFLIFGKFGESMVKNFMKSFLAVLFVHPVAVFFLKLATSDKVIQIVSEHSELYLPCAYLLTIGVTTLFIAPAFTGMLFFGGAGLLSAISHGAAGSVFAMGKAANHFKMFK